MRISSKFAVTLALVAGTSYGQGLSTEAADPVALAADASTAKSPPQSASNPQKFGQVGHPHVLPMRTPEYFLNPAPLPAAAHLSYYGGRVVSNLQVVMVQWGAGRAS